LVESEAPNGARRGHRHQSGGRTFPAKICATRKNVLAERRTMRVTRAPEVMAH
jgi:hypothetical protein